MNDWNITEKEAREKAKALVVALQGIFEDEDDVEQVAGEARRLIREAGESAETDAERGYYARIDFELGSAVMALFGRA